MEAYYILIVAVLFILAISDLIVGVSNDAVNFLNSAIGSKAGTFKLILAIAAVGVLVGAVFSNGMMEVARKGIFNPQSFAFTHIMVIFLAVMLAKHGRTGIEIQAVADVVTVEHETVEPAGVEHVVEHIGHGALTAAAQPSEPHHAPLVAVPGFAFRAGNVVFVPMNLNMDVIGHRAADSFLYRNKYPSQSGAVDAS